jgi:hypothetical protein
MILSTSISVSARLSSADRSSHPTPRGQEAQLDQVVEAHRIAREGRIDNASGKEEEDDDQDQFSSCVLGTRSARRQFVH